MDSFSLIEKFGERLGITIERNPNGAYFFEIDNRAFSIHDLHECEKIVLSGDLGHPPPECKEEICVALLEAQHMLKNTAGATFSIDPETGNFSLCKALTPAILDDEKFFLEAENFINALHAWADIIGNFRPKTTMESDSLSRLSNSGFLSV